jgi:uncharacterized Tic20 family protein
MASEYLGKPCPKCAYVRTAADTAPDYQCPKCDVVYAKFGQAPPPKAAPAARRPAADEPAAEAATESPGLAKLAHLSSLGNLLLPPIGTIVPIALWVVKSGEDEFTVDSAKEALNFQLSVFLWALAVLLPIVVFPPFVFVSWLVLVALAIACIVMPIVATIRVSDGVRY